LGGKGGRSKLCRSGNGTQITSMEPFQQRKPTKKFLRTNNTKIARRGKTPNSKKEIGKKTTHSAAGDPGIGPENHLSRFYQTMSEARLRGEIKGTEQEGEHVDPRTRSALLENWLVARALVGGGFGNKNGEPVGKEKKLLNLRGRKRHYPLLRYKGKKRRKEYRREMKSTLKMA